MCTTMGTVPSLPQSQGATSAGALPLRLDRSRGLHPPWHVTRHTREPPSLERGAGSGLCFRAIGLFLPFFSLT